MNISLSDVTLHLTLSVSVYLGAVGVGEVDCQGVESWVTHLERNIRQLTLEITIRIFRRRTYALQEISCRRLGA